MATTTTEIGRPLGFRPVRWLAMGAAIGALLTGLTVWSIGTGESTDVGVQSAASLTMIKAPALEALGGAVAVAPVRIPYTEFKVSQVEALVGAVTAAPTRIPHTEFKLNQVADMAFAGGVAEIASNDHTRFKVEQVKGQSAGIPVRPNLVE